MRYAAYSKKVPAWSGFQSLTSQKSFLCEVNVGYQEAITETPTKYETIYKILQNAESNMNDLKLSYIFLEVDQAIYTKVMDVKFQLYNNIDFDKVIVRMGGFHVIICIMRSIYSRFRGFGFVDLLSSIGTVGGPGTIQSALQGGNVKMGIRLYKLLFESFYRIKIKSLEKTMLTSESSKYRIYKTKIRNVKDDSGFKGLPKLMQDELTRKILDYRGKEDMERWIDLFLDGTSFAQCDTLPKNW